MFGKRPEVLSKSININDKGMAQDESAKKVAVENTLRAIELASKRLGKITGGMHGKCAIEIKGVGGSYANGKPRLGIYPNDITYEQAEDREMEKAMVRNGAHFIHEPLPSDVDLVIKYVSVRERHRVTNGDVNVMIRKTKEVLGGVLKETGVFISPHDAAYPIVPKPTEIVVARLKKDFL